MRRDLKSARTQPEILLRGCPVCITGHDAWDSVCDTRGVDTEGRGDIRKIFGVRLRMTW